MIALPDLIVDYEGYRSRNHCIFKELTILSRSRNRGISFVFQMERPFERLSLSMQKNVRWCEKRYHKLPYYEGDTSQATLYALKTIISLAGVPLLAKGQTKCSFLREFFKVPVTDLKEYVHKPPTYLELSNTFPAKPEDFCEAHRISQNPHCSQFKAKLLNDYVQTVKM